MSNGAARLETINSNPSEENPDAVAERSTKSGPGRVSFGVPKSLVDSDASPRKIKSRESLGSIDSPNGEGQVERQATMRSVRSSFANNPQLASVLMRSTQDPGGKEGTHSTGEWASSFHIRAVLPTKQCQQILEARNASWKKNSTVSIKSEKSMWRLLHHRLTPSAAQHCRQLLTTLAVVAVVFALLQLSIEPACELHSEQDATRVLKILHGLCSIVYFLLSFSLHFQIFDVEPQRGEEHLELSQVLRHCIRTAGFWYDVVSCVGMLAEIVHLPSTRTGGRPTPPQWIILFHFAKFWRVYSSSASSLRSSTIQVFVLFLWLAFAAHASACLFALMAVLENDAGMSTWADKSGLLQKEPRSCAELYMAALYFSTYTLASIGYGDIVPANSQEQLIAVVIMLASQMFAAKVFADLNWITSTSNYWMAQHHARMAQTSAALQSMRVPLSLRQRVLACQDFIDHVLKERRVQESFQDLSPPLNEELRLAVYHSLVMQAPFLQAQPIEVIRLIIQSLTDRVYLPGDFVMRKGDLGTELLFLRSGQVAVFAESHQPCWESIEIAILATGSYFGEAALLTGRPRAAWILARTYCVCSVLAKPALDDITDVHPSSLVILVREMQRVMKLQPKITWAEISAKLAQEFEDELSAFDWFCDDTILGTCNERLISWAKFEQNLRRLQVPDLDAKLLWAEMDDDCSGLVDFDEFCAQLALGAKAHEQKHAGEEKPGAPQELPPALPGLIPDEQNVGENAGVDGEGPCTDTGKPQEMDALESLRAYMAARTNTNGLSNGRTGYTIGATNDDRKTSKNSNISNGTNCIVPTAAVGNARCNGNTEAQRQSSENDPVVPPPEGPGPELPDRTGSDDKIASKDSDTDLTLEALGGLHTSWSLPIKPEESQWSSPGKTSRSPSKRSMTVGLESSFGHMASDGRTEKLKKSNSCKLTALDALRHRRRTVTMGAIGSGNNRPGVNATLSGDFPSANSSINNNAVQQLRGYLDDQRILMEEQRKQFEEHRDELNITTERLLAAAAQVEAENGITSRPPGTSSRSSEQAA